MGQKVSPVGLRIGINKTWESKWYAGNNDFAKFLGNDHKIRKFLEKKLSGAAVSSVEIERKPREINRGVLWSLGSPLSRGLPYASCLPCLVQYG